jgi:acyl-CoA dehydrogenase
VRAASPPESAGALREQVRGFLAEARAAGAYEPRCDAWLSGFSPELSREIGRRGWIGMTWPAGYGGGERSALDRFAVIEEILAAGAPVAAHWVADRQSGAQILRHGSDALKDRVLPAIARGECYWALGLSEPDSGSDLASVRTRARPAAGGGWRLDGGKIWSSHAHRCHWISVLCRTSAPTADRHAGLSVLAVDLSSPGVTVRPIRSLGGESHFNEVVFDDVAVPDEMLLGEPGDGWRLTTAELSLERSGPERFLSTFPLLAELVRESGPDPAEPVAVALGDLAADLATLRRLSLDVAAIIERGADPVVEAALVKDLGTRFEGRVAEVVRSVAPCEPSLGSERALERRLAEAILAAPGFTLRGGSSEILRGIVARSLEATR